MRRIVRVPTSFPEMENAVADINNEGEDVVSVASDGAGALFVVVETRKQRRAAPGEKETR
jgi:hypothetical protein